jgi:formate dehydrogenase subunit beta
MATNEMKKALLPTHGDANRALAALLRGLVEKGIVDAVMAPARQPSGGVAQAVFADPAEMDAILPWAPVMPVQAARLASRLSFGDTGARVAVVLRPCEARATVELIKLKQIRPEKLLFVTLDCPGTMELAAFAKAGLDAAGEAARMLGEAETGAASGAKDAPLRLACTVCENPAAAWGQLRVHAFGAKAAEALGIEAEAELAGALEAAGLMKFDGGAVPAREAVVSKLTAERVKARDALFASFGSEAEGLPGLKKAFSTCIRCLNCMENCPICYCKLCIFKSPTFDHPSENYARWAKRKGVQKMPSETMLFHLTRLNHMASSCIGCGVCDTACPMGLPVATLFRKVASGVQAMLEYTPGRSTEDPIPLTVFREDELKNETGSGD